MAALPPSRMSKSIKCEAGVAPLPDNSGYAAFVSWHGHEQGTRYEESLGLKQKPWFAGVAHDVALCARAFHAGDRQLRGLQHAGSSGRSGERLNFPLSCYVDQPPFWTALEKMSFGELVMKLRTSRDLEKTLFFGDEWKDGLGKQRLASEAQRQQQTAPQRQQQHEPAAPARHAHQAGSSVPRSGSSDERQGSAARVAGLAPASAATAHEGRSGKPAAPPAKQQEQTAAAAAAAADHQQQQQAGSPTKPEKSPGSPTAAQKPDAPGEPSAAAGGAAVAGQVAAAVKAGHANGGLAPSSSSDEDEPLIARQQQTKAKQRLATPATSPATTPSKAGAATQATGAALHAQQQQQQPQQPVPPRPGKEAEPKTVWGKPAEFPAGSGKYAFYLKEGPLSKGYFTIANEADIALLGQHEGAVTLRDAATGKSWPVKTTLKRTGASVSRYLSATTAFNRENELRPHDVLWLSAGKPHGQQLLFGVWRWGSPEAAAFKAHLGSGKPGSGKKRTRAQLLEEAAAAAAAAGSGGAAGSSDDEDDVPLSQARHPQHKRQQAQQQAASSSDEDQPLLLRRQPAGARPLSPATAKAAIEELFDDDDS